jgi:ATPase family associated with various cellular activities (AAA)
MSTRRTTAPAALSAAELIAIRARALLERRLAWLATGAGDAIEDERRWNKAQPGGDAVAAQKRLAGREGAAWQRLVALFTLDAPEQALLQLALAQAIEPALAPLIAAAQGANGWPLPTETLVKRLEGLPPRPIWRPTGALASWALVRSVASAPGEALRFEADARLVDWMFGAVSLDHALVLAVKPITAESVPREWPVKASAARFDRAIKAGGDVRLVVEARAGSGRRRFAAAVAEALGRKALVVDPTPLGTADWAENFMRLQRFALYTGAALIWRPGAPAWPDKVPLAPVQMICAEAGEAPPQRDGATSLIVTLPDPGPTSKAAAWRRLAPDLASASQLIATIPGLSLSDLEEAARAAPASVDEATSHLRALARSRMQGIGRVVDPQFGWDDLVVPPEVEAQLRRVAFEARARARLLGEPDAARLFSGTAGLSALFTGPPGVGKSMAAQVVARDLGVNLLVIDLATSTSKYIGETAKNLTLAFARARAAGAALLFDEADALFARRTDIKDSNDRHANADTGHLLQLIEAHDGVVILATNRRANIDPAFSRRLRHSVDFPRPAPAQRATVWRLALAALGSDPAAMADDVQTLAERHDLSPAQIKGAVLSARYAALAANRKLVADDLDAGACAELLKEGRAASPSPVIPLRRGKMVMRG